VAGAAYYLYNYRINQINQRANLDKLLAQTEMKALHTQMNPHFIFNCLNSIKKMILDNENGKSTFTYLIVYGLGINVDYFYNRTPLMVLYAVTETANTASENVLRKAGFQPLETKMEGEKELLVLIIRK